VLQARSVRFDPQPSGIFDAASRLAVGHVVKLTMRFDHRLWMRHPQLATFSFVHAIDGAFPTWWTRGQMLTAWAGGRQVDRVSGMSRDELVSSAIDTFARISGIDSPRLMSELGAVHFHDWSVDPFSLGAYSYVPVGALEAAEALSQPVEETLYYAGEACGGSGQWGTVHGAMESGESCARAILDARR
jgi:monoamine oxidase